MTATRWWRDAVWYEVFVPSFADGDGDGLGDLNGVRSRLDHIEDLGVDAIWLTPFYPSPMVDAGYDIADYCDVDPRMGSLEDFDALVEQAHRRGLRIAVDVVPNHTSDRHPWFVEAVAAPPGSPARARYHFAHGRGGGTQPPNNWRSSIGGGPAWTRLDDGDWYLHLFTPAQPDLNWRHPDVHALFDEVLRFWLDRGVDGIRIDVAYGLYKQADLADDPGPFDTQVFGVGPERGNSFNRPEVLDVHRHWRALLDAEGDKAAVGEVWVRSDYSIAAYAAALHQVFNFKLIRAGWSAPQVRDVVNETLTTMEAAGAPATWALGNHDVERVATRYGGGDRGRRRAVAALLMQLALPGAVYLYAGDELALPAASVPPERRRDAVWRLSSHHEVGRDPSRAPLPWEGKTPPYGFTSGHAETWLPQPKDWESLTVAAQESDPLSPLSVTRQALAVRRDWVLRSEDCLRWRETGDDNVLAFVRGRGPGAVHCVLNFGISPCGLPNGELLVSSSPLEGGRLPGESTAWLRGLA